MSEEEIIGEIEKLEANKEDLPFKRIKINDLKRKLIEMTDLKTKGVVVIGDNVLTWHPKMRTKKWSDGVMMIYTRESYFRRNNAIETHKQKNWK